MSGAIAIVTADYEVPCEQQDLTGWQAGTGGSAAPKRALCI